MSMMLIDDMKLHMTVAARQAVTELGYANCQVQVRPEMGLIEVIVWLPMFSWRRLVWWWRGGKGFERVEAAVRRHVTMAPRTPVRSDWFITVLLEER